MDKQTRVDDDVNTGSGLGEREGRGETSPPIVLNLRMMPLAVAAQVVPDPGPEAEPEPVPEPPSPPPKPKPKPKSRVVPKQPRPPVEAKRVPVLPKKAPLSKKAPQPKQKVSTSKVLPVRKAPAVSDRHPLASNTVASPGRTSIEQRYKHALLARLVKLKRYPRAARIRHQQGEALVGFLIKADGQVLEVKLIKSSGTPVLDKAALSAVKRLRQVAEIPEALNRRQWRLTVPIRFSLR